jgi:microcystin-dependent protein
VIPAGVVEMYAGSTIPNGWLLCDGRSTGISRTTYADLFAAIGTTYGSGDGSTTFNLPDMRSRMPIGVGTGTGLTNRTLGGSSGVETRTIAESNLPTHSHTINHDHAAFTTTGSEGAHTHPITTDTLTSVVSHGHGAGSEVMGGSGSTPSGTGSSATNSAGAHNHSIDVPNFTGSSGNGGFANTAIDIMNPFLGLNFIIKT